MKLFNKNNLALIAIALVMSSTEGLGMCGCWSGLKKLLTRNASQLNNSSEGFNFEKQKNELLRLNPDHIQLQQTFLDTCRQVADGEVALNKAHSDVDFLLKMPISPNITDKKSGKTPLHFAAQAEAAPLVETLIGWDAKVNITDKSLSTPLHYAVQRGNLEICKKLLDAGADDSVKDNTGKSPLDYAQKFPVILNIMGVGPEGQAHQNKDIEEHKE